MSDYFDDKNLLDRREKSDTLAVDGVLCPLMAYKYMPVSGCKDCGHLTREYPHGEKIQCDYEHWYKNVYLEGKYK